MTMTDNFAFYYFRSYIKLKTLGGHKECCYDSNTYFHFRDWLPGHRF